MKIQKDNLNNKIPEFIETIKKKLMRQKKNIKKKKDVEKLMKK